MSMFLGAMLLFCFQQSDFVYQQPPEINEANIKKVFAKLVSKPLTDDEASLMRLRFVRLCRDDRPWIHLQNAEFCQLLEQSFRDEFKRDPTAEEWYEMALYFGYAEKSMRSIRRAMKKLFELEEDTLVMLDPDLNPLRDRLIMDCHHGRVARTNDKGEVTLRYSQYPYRHQSLFILQDGDEFSMMFTDVNKPFSKETVRRKKEAKEREITGKVTDEEGKGVVGARIYLQADDLPLFEGPYGAITDAIGQFQLKNIHPQIAFPRVTVSHPRFIEKYEELPLSDRVELTVSMKRGFRIRGKVTGPDHKPVSLATVRASRYRSQNGVLTDSNGVFEIQTANQGDEFVVAEKRGLAIAWKKINVAKQNDVPIELEMTKGAMITGKVTDSNGKPVVGKQISYATFSRYFGFTDHESKPILSNSDTSDDEGNYELGPFPEGSSINFRIEHDFRIVHFSGIKAGTRKDIRVKAK